MSNIYYHPEKWDLTVIAELEHSDGCYQFDTSMAWKHTDGTVYFAESAGCSCPAPFEEYTELSDLTRVSPANIAQLEEQMRNRENYRRATYAEIRNFFDAVKQAMEV